MESSFAQLALLTDLDGTLLKHDKTVSERDARAIADFRQKGGKFSIATGRGLQASRTYLEQFLPDYPAVLYNGCALYDYGTEKFVYQATLPKETKELVEELIEHFPDVGAEFLRAEGVFPVHDSPYERKHLEITKIPFAMYDINEIAAQECFKVLFAGSPERIGELIDFMNENARFDIVTRVRSHEWFVEFLPKGISKGSALHELRKFLPQGTVFGATGDFDNDAKMLEVADISGCPSTAQACVKDAVAAKGGYLSDCDCNTDFFAHWLEFFIKSAF